MKRLAVYCGSATPADLTYIDAARHVGRTLAKRGIGVVYGVGIPWYSAMSGMGLWEAFAGTMIAFIPGDLIKAGIAAAVIVAVKRAYPLISPNLARSRA